MYNNLQFKIIARQLMKRSFSCVFDWKSGYDQIKKSVCKRMRTDKIT